jgi:hypothetical protein
MLINPRIALLLALAIGTASTATAATKHPVQHRGSVIRQQVPSWGGDTYGYSNPMSPSKDRPYNLLWDPDFIAPQGVR